MDVYTRTAFRFAAIVAFGGLIFGLDAALISGTTRFISSEFGLSDLQLGTVVGAPGFGVLFALMATGPICDALGRKKTLLIISSLYLLSAVASMLAPSYESLVGARFLGGLAFTSLSLASMYIGEIAPPHIRGKLVAMNQISIVIGLSAAYAINFGLVQALGEGQSALALMGQDVAVWRIMLGAEVLPALLWLLLVLTIPESPRWLLAAGKEAEARVVMARLMPEGEVHAEVARIKESAGHGSHSAKTLKGRVLDLLDRNVRRAMIVGFVFAIVQPVTGVNAILFYAPMVFEQTGVGTSASFGQTLIIGFVSLIFTVVALALIDRVGRRPLVIVGLIWSVISLMMCSWAFAVATYTLDASAMSGLMVTVPAEVHAALLALEAQTFHSDIAFKQALIAHIGQTAASQYESVLIQAAVTINAPIVLIGIVGFIAAFHLSIGPIMWVVFSEVVPIHIRGIAIPLFAFLSSAISYFVQQFFPWQLNNQGAAEIFMFYGIAGFAGLILLGWILPETKNKSIEEIEALLAVSDSEPEGKLKEA